MNHSVYGINSFNFYFLACEKEEEMQKILGKKSTAWKNKTTSIRTYSSIYKTFFLRSLSLFAASRFFFFPSYICVYTERRKHAKATRTQKKVQTQIVKLTFSNLFLSLFRFLFHFVRLKPYVCILRCVFLRHFLFSIQFSFRKESKFVFLETYQHMHSVLKSIDIGIHRCI